MSDTPEIDKLRAWFAKKKAEGMVDYKLVVRPVAAFPDIEGLARAINAFNEACDDPLRCTPFTDADWDAIDGKIS